METIHHNRRVLGVVIWSYWSKLTLSSYMNFLYPYVIMTSKLTAIHPFWYWQGINNSLSWNGGWYPFRSERSASSCNPLLPSLHKTPTGCGVTMIVENFKCMCNCSTRSQSYSYVQLSYMTWYSVFSLKTWSTQVITCLVCMLWVSSTAL